MYSPTVDFNGSSRPVKCFAIDPVNHSQRIYLDSLAPIDVKQSNETKVPLYSDPYFNSAKSFPKNFQCITFDPVNNERVFYTEYSSKDSKLNPEKALMPAPEDSTIDSDISLDSDDSEYEEHSNTRLKRKNLSINERILKQVKSLRKHSLPYQRQTMDYIDAVYVDRKKNKEREDREIELLELILNTLRN